jgi:inorganic pyrophosphatase
MADDGDPLDVLVVIAEPTFPGCVVRARPIGVLDMADEKGHDYKILAVAHDDPRWDEAHDLEDVSPHRLREIENFFETYKTLEKSPTDVRGWLGVDDAWRIIDAARAAGASGDPAKPGTWR